MAANWWDSYKRADDEEKWWESYKRADEPAVGAGGGRGSINPPLVGQPQPTYPRATAPAAAPGPAAVDYSQAATDMMGTPTAIETPLGRSVLDMPDTRDRTQDVGFMLRPEFVERVRNDFAKVPADKRREALIAAASGENGVNPQVSLAAQRILAEVKAEDDMLRREGLLRQGTIDLLVKTPPGQPAAPKRGSAPPPAPRVDFPDMTPTFSETLDMVPEQERVQQRLRRDDITRGVVAAETSLPAIADRADRESRDFQAEEFARNNPKLAALASGAGQNLAGLLNAVPLMMDFAGRLIDKDITRAPNAPGVDDIRRTARSLMPKEGQQRMEDAWDKGEFGTWLGLNLIAQAPQMANQMIAALAPATRPFLLPAMGAMSAGSAYAEGDSSLGAVLKGGAEIVGEKITLGVFDKAYGALSKLPLSLRAPTVQAVGKQLAAFGGAVTAQTAAGAIEEATTQVIQNGVDRFVEGKDTPLLDRVAESAVLGAFMEGPMAVPYASRAFRSGTSAFNEALQGDIASTRAADTDPYARAVLDPQNYQAETIRPQQTVRAAGEVGPSAPLRTDAGLVSGAAIEPLTPTPPPPPPPPPAPPAPPDLTARADTALDNIRNAASVDDAVGNLDAAAGTGMLDTLTPPAPPPLVTPSLGLADPTLESQYGLDQLRALNPALPATDATAPAPAPLAATPAAPAPLAAPRPTTIRGTPVVQLTDDALVQIVGDETAPPISRRSASIELTARQTQAPELRQTATTASLMAPFAGTQGAPSATIQDTGPAAQTTGATNAATDTQPGSVGLPDAQAGMLGGDPATADARARAQRTLDRWATETKQASPIKLGTATPEEEAAVNQIAQALGSQFGSEGGGQIFAFSDPKSGVEGLTVSGMAFVNTAAPKINSAKTALHEFKHVVEQIADAETKAGMTGTAAQQFTQQIESIFDDISDPGKRAYVERFLHKEELDAIFNPATGKGTGTQADREARLAELVAAPTTRKEMTADFLGNRAPDKQFWRDLAQQDPQGFTGFVQKWIGIVDNLLAKLKGSKGQNRDESARVDTYVKDLQKAKMVAREALIAYSKSTRAETAAAQTPAAATTQTATAETGTALALAQSNNTFTGQALGAGRSVGMTQPKGTPVEKLFSNFADMKLPANWVDQTGQKRTREQVEAQNSERFREGMFARANKNPQQFAMDPLSTQTFDLGDGVSVQLDAAKAGNTRVQMRVGDDVVAAAAIQKGMVDAVAVPERFKGQEYGAKLLGWVNDNGVANIEEVPDRSPGFVAIQKKVLSQARSEQSTAKESTPAPQFSKARTEDLTPAPLTEQITYTGWQNTQPREVPVVPASRNLNRLVDRLDSGQMSPAEFEMGVRMLAGRMANAADAKQHNRSMRERERGADLVREKLLAARRRGDVDPDTTEFALWALDQNPAIATGLGFSVRTAPEGAKGSAGDYNPFNEVARVFKGSANQGTAVHEILHHSERMMPREVQLGVSREWSKAYSKALKNATGPQREALRMMLDALAGSTIAQREVRQAFRDGVLDADKHYQLTNPSEYWAVNATRILNDRFMRSQSWVGRARQWLGEMLEKAKGLFGLRSDAPVLRGLGAVLSGDGSFQSQTMLSEAKEYNSLVRPAVPEETEISTQNPQAVNRLYNPIDDMLSIDEAAVREAMALPVKSGKTPLAESITNAILGYGFVPRDTPRDKVIEVYKQSIVSNLMYLFGKVPRNIRERSKLWYDGAHRIATDMGKVYGVKMEQVAGIMAAMSPQKDWFQNVSMAERALDILTGQGNKAWDDNMLAYAKSYVEETRDRKEREKRQKAYDRAVAVAKAGTVLNDMNEDDAAVFIRSYDEAYHSRQYRIVTPEGGFGDLVRNADGTPSTMMWSTYDPIVKSVSIFRDGSRKNISEQLGEEHKIRSFYNNIAAPNSLISHVTIDTHAVAAGHFEALAGTDKEVTDNFGGTGGSSLLGVGGTYGIVADAYRTAAKMAGVSAREMQSITWEAVRGLFGENIKSSIKPKVREVWSQFRDGKLSFAAARRAIVKIAEGYNKTKGGILNPDWVGSGPGQSVAEGGTSYDKSFVPEGGVRLRESKELREKVTINLSAATSTIPGLKELYARALAGETEATELLQQVAESSLRFLLGGTKARLVVAPSTGVYMSDREPSISIQVAFDESESKPVLAALAAFADSYNQQQIHVRVPTIQMAGHEFGDGSYATPVYEIDLRQELTPADISAIIEDSGLAGFTVTPKTLTAYWVKPTDKAQHADDFRTFRARVTRVQALVGEGSGRPKQRVERLYAYGEGDGARVPYSAIRGDVRTKAEADLDTPRLIAEYLNKGPVRTFAQKPLTAAQTKEQKQLVQVFEALPSNDLDRPIVRQAYDALASALKEQFQVLPIKVEVMATVDIDGKAYPYWGPKAQTLVGKLVDDGMTADQARRALQYLQRNYGTPSKSWKSGPLSKVKAMDGEPYPNSAAMRRDVSVNNRFRVYKTAPATFGPPGSDFSAHPLLQDSGLKDANGYPMLYNDLLRAVHDYFAHNLSATQFGPSGELAAWRNHMASTQDPLARWALTAETRLQNAWQNFRPGAEKLTLLERGFAQQKAALPPVQFTLTGDAQVDAPMQAFIKGLPQEDLRGSLPPDAKIKGMAAVSAPAQEPTPAPQFSRARSPLGFYSALADGIDNIKTNVAPAGGWKDAIKGLVNKGQVKADEVEWSGINDWLDLQQGKVTKQQVADYLEQGGVKVEETVLSDEGTTDLPAGWRVREATEDDDAAYRYVLVDENNEVRGEGATSAEAMADGWDPDSAAERPTKHSQWVLPGGQNYREVLLTLPNTPGPESAEAKLKEVNAFKQAMREKYGNGWLQKATPEELERNRMLSFASAEAPAAQYRSRHWDQPNVLAHIRMNDRTDAEGNRVLFVEELQSDWGQEGKKQGFKGKTQEDAKRFFGISDADWNKASEEDREAYRLEMLDAKGRDIIPAAPFVTKTEGWLNLALKRVMVMAAEGGYDKVAFVNGEQSAKRYDLSKQVDDLRYGDGMLVALQNGAIVVNKEAKPEELPDLVGKEIAERLLQAPEMPGNGYRRLTGLDLKIGGEGMKTFYDTIVPTALKKLLPKVGGGQVGVVGLRTSEPRRPGKPAPKGMEQPGFDVTDAMRGKVEEGVPMFSRARPSVGVGRDELGYTNFGIGAMAYAKVATVTNNVLDALSSATKGYAAFKPIDPQLNRAIRKMKVELEKTQNLTANVAKQLNDIPEDERKMISDVIEGELKAGVVPPQRVLQLAASMSQIMSQQSAELVRLGMLTPEAAQRWENKYLPRFYEQKLGDEVKAWAKAAKSLFGKTRAMAGIRGNSLKARGMFETVDVADLPAWQAQGWEIRDADYDPATSTDVRVWRDFTRDERDNMGEIRDAMFRFVMGYMGSQRDVALGRLYERLEAEVASRTEKPGYVLVPKTLVEDTVARRYGKLAGKWVPREVMDHLSALDSSTDNEVLQLYKKGLTKWKEGKTVLNPVAHANNIISNLTMAHFAGVSYWDAGKYAGTVRDLMRNSVLVTEAKDAGLFGGTFNRAELMDELPPQLRMLAGMTESKLAKGGNLVWNAMSFFLNKPLGKAYDAEDKFFRFLIYREARNRGLDIDDAVDYAQRYIFSYDNLPKGARAVRDFGLPFFGYTYGVIPVVARTALEHPLRMAAPMALVSAASTAMYAMAAGLGDDDDWYELLKRYLTDPEFRKRAQEMEADERQNLPEWMKGRTALGTQKTIRLGEDAVTGLPMFLDISRMVPAGDIFDVNNQAGGIPVPAPFTPNNPVLTTLYTMFANKDTFKGKDLVNQKLDTNAEAAEKRGEWLWRQFTPALAVGNYHFDRTMDAIANATGKPIDLGIGEYTGVGRDGLPVQPSLAALQTFGIKARPIDLEMSERFARADRERIIKDLQSQISQINRLEGRGAITPETAEKQRELQREKIQRVRDRLTVDGEPVR